MSEQPSANLVSLPPASQADQLWRELCAAHKEIERLNGIIAELRREIDEAADAR